MEVVRVTTLTIPDPYKVELRAVDIFTDPHTEIEEVFHITGEIDQDTIHFDFGPLGSITAPYDIIDNVFVVYETGVSLSDANLSQIWFGEGLGKVVTGAASASWGDIKNRIR